MELFFTISFSKNYYVISDEHPYDKYYLFIERNLDLLKANGYVGYIVPHKFMTIKAGKNLRKIITDGTYLIHLIHFGVQQVFENKSSTYTCILILKKSDNSHFDVEFVRDLTSWKYGTPENIVTYESSSIDDDPWVFVPPKLEQVFSRLQDQIPTVLKDDADIFVGVQTSADKIYLIRPIKESKRYIHFIDQYDAKWKIERAILRPCLLDVPLLGFSTPVPNAYMIFPYKITNENRSELFTPKEMKTKFPECWKYLNIHKAALKERNIQGYTPRTWYRFGRSQSLTKFNGLPKLIWPVLSLEPRYAYDDNNVLITGGGNGPYYALRPKSSSQLSILYILAVLSHPLIEAFVRSRSSKFRGGYGSHGKQFIENIPLKRIDFDNSFEKSVYDEIVDTTEQLIKITEAFIKGTTPHRKRLYERQILVLKENLFKAIGKLYGLTFENLKSLETVS